MLNEPSDAVGLSEQMMFATIFDKFPSKRKLMRDTKKIKVSFGQFESNLVFPRMENNHKVQETEGRGGDSSLDLQSIENEFYEQAQRLQLLNHVQSSGLITGSITSARDGLDYMTLEPHHNRQNNLGGGPSIDSYLRQFNTNVT